MPEMYFEILKNIEVKTGAKKRKQQQKEIIKTDLNLKTLRESIQEYYGMQLKALD